MPQSYAGCDWIECWLNITAFPASESSKTHWPLSGRPHLPLFDCMGPGRKAQPAKVDGCTVKECSCHALLDGACACALSVLPASATLVKLTVSLPKALCR